jgi:hypothetical protein
MEPWLAVQLTTVYKLSTLVHVSSMYIDPIVHAGSMGHACKINYIQATLPILSTLCFLTQA